MDKKPCFWFCCQCGLNLSVALTPSCVLCDHQRCVSCLLGDSEGCALGSASVSSLGEIQRERGYRHAGASDFRRYPIDNPSKRRAQQIKHRLRVYDRRLANRNDFPSVWEHQIVPFLVVFLPTWLRSPQGKHLDESYSVDVFRGTRPETLAYRFIHITVAQPKPLAWRVLVAESIIQRLPTPYRQATRFLFARGRVERLVSNAHGVSAERPDYICAPERPHYEKSPSAGASIGIEGDLTASATFGGRILLQDASRNNVECFLTCSHLFQNAGEGAVITQPSPEEAVLLNERIAETANLIKSRHRLRDHQVLALKDEMRECTEILESYPEDKVEMRLGYLLCKSGPRAVDYRLSSEEPDPLDDLSSISELTVPLSEMVAQVEMDWAVGVIYGSRSGRNRLPSADQRFFTGLTRHQHHSLIHNDHNPIFCEDAGEFEPSAEVYSIGRTSGLQRGRISETPSIIKMNGRPNNCYNREWVVLQHEEDQPDEAYWVSHGMGTPGDSGSWLFGVNNVLYGMIWGRNKGFGDGPRKAIFTPIVDVFDDIAEVLECDPPVLPRPVPAASTPQTQRYGKDIDDGDIPDLTHPTYLFGDGCMSMAHVSPGDEAHPNATAGTSPNGDNDALGLSPEESSTTQLDGDFGAILTEVATSFGPDLDAILEAYFDDAWPDDESTRSSTRPPSEE